MSVNCAPFIQAASSFFLCFLSQHNLAIIKTYFLNFTSYLSCFPTNAWVSAVARQCSVKLLCITNVHGMNYLEGGLPLYFLSLCLFVLNLLPLSFLTSTTLLTSTSVTLKGPDYLDLSFLGNKCILELDNITKSLSTNSLFKIFLFCHFFIPSL